MPIFAYTRVSTLEQSVENQRAEILAAGYSIDEGFFFADSGVSGKVPALERPGFKRMLDRVRPYETIVVSKLDRLGRDAVDILNTLDLLKQMSVQIVVLQLGKLDLNSSAGRLMLTMLSAVAEMERSLIVERTVAGQARAWEQGKQKGRPRSYGKAEEEEIHVQLKAGISISQISRNFNISRATVLNIKNAFALA